MQERENGHARLQKLEDEQRKVREEQQPLIHGKLELLAIQVSKEKHH